MKTRNNPPSKLKKIVVSATSRNQNQNKWMLDRKDT